jgi:hypothetical protein
MMHTLSGGNHGNAWHFGAWVFGDGGWDPLTIPPGAVGSIFGLSIEAQGDPHPIYHCFVLTVDRLWDFRTRTSVDTRNLLTWVRNRYEIEAIVHRHCPAISPIRMRRFTVANKLDPYWNYHEDRGRRYGRF